MLPDAQVHWVPYPSQLDRLAGRLAYPVDRGIVGGSLHLVIRGSDAELGIFGVKVDCAAVNAIDEMFDDVLGFGGGRDSGFDRAHYIHKATLSAAVRMFEEVDFAKRKYHHFMFPGIDMCFYTLSQGEPAITEFRNADEAEAWVKEATIQ